MAGNQNTDAIIAECGGDTGHDHGRKYDESIKAQSKTRINNTIDDCCYKQYEDNFEMTQPLLFSYWRTDPGLLETKPVAKVSTPGLYRLVVFLEGAVEQGSGKVEQNYQ